MKKLLSSVILLISSVTFVLPALRPTPTLAQVIPTITSISTDIVSLSDPVSSQATFAIYGTDLSDILGGRQTVWLGSFSGVVNSGNSTGISLTFTISQSDLPSDNYPLVVTQDGVIIYTSEALVPVVNIFSLNPDRKTARAYLKNVAHKKLSKKRVGLNVHYGLGSSSDVDATLEARLKNTNTRWMREHFSDALIMGEDQDAWLKRYDKAMQFAVDNHIRVVGMLAYGPTDGDYSKPSKQDWQNFVDLTVDRYKNVVDVWEVWNEPDSSDYLDPSTKQNYIHLLKQASQVIRRDDPDAIILGGALAGANSDWAETLFKQAGDYFDDLSVHIYECQDFLNTGRYEELDEEWQKLQTVVRTYRPKVQIWVTELGCSTGSKGVGEREQRRATKHLTNHLLNTGSVEVIFLYTIRDRAFLENSDPYEAYFGLLNSDFSPKLVWKWYRKIRLKPRET